MLAINVEREKNTNSGSGIKVTYDDQSQGLVNTSVIVYSTG